MKGREWIWLLLIVAALVFSAVVLSGCNDEKLLTRNFARPEKAEPVKPKVDEVAKPLEQADKVAEELARAVPEELRPKAALLVDHIIEARIRLAEAQAAAGVHDAQYDRLYQLVCDLMKQVDALQKHVKKLEDDTSIGIAGWFIMIGGLIIAAGVAVAIWVKLMPGVLAASVGVILFGLGLVLRFIAANMWIVWVGGLILAAAGAFVVYQTGALAKFIDRLKDYIGKMGGTIAEQPNAVELARATSEKGTEGLGAILEEQGVLVDITKDSPGPPAATE